LALLVAVALGLIAILQQVPAGDRELQYLAPGARLGRGPHATVDCEPNADLVAELVSMIAQLREAATEERWSVDWNKFNEQDQKGNAAVQHRDFGLAVHEYASALRFMMNELRNQRARNKNGAY
jgi:hypothetical protein